MYNIYANGKLIYDPGSESLRLISPKLTVEMGKAGSLEFEIPPTNTYYNELQQLKATLTVDQDGTELFRGRVLTNKRNFTNIRDIYGEGNLAYLVDSVQKAEKYTGKAHALFTKIIAAHNTMIQDKEKQFTVGRITVEDRDVFLAGQSDEIEDQNTNKFDYKQIAINSIADEWQNTFDFIESCLIDYCGGYLRTRYNAAKDITYIDWLKDYFDTTTQTIEYGKNILDLTEEVSAEDVFSVLVPIGDENLTVKDVDDYTSNESGGIKHTKGSVEIVSTAAVKKYGRIVKSNVFDNVNNAETLLQNGIRYLQNNINLSATLTITAVDMHLLNPSVQTISLGDKVHVISTGHGIDDSELVCTKIEYDLANPANTVYTFGKPKQTLTDRYKQDKKKQSDEAARSGGCGGGGSGKAAEQNAENDSLDFYKAWVNVDDKNGHIDLGTLFKRLYPDKEKTLIKGTTTITMDSNPDHSAINLYADHIRYDRDRQVLAARCGIDMDTYTHVDSQGNVSGHAITSITSIYDESTKASNEYTEAQIKLTADALGSRIDLTADKIIAQTKKFTIETNDKTIASFDENYANINSRITTINSRVTEIKSTTDDHTRSIARFTEKLTTFNSDVVEITGMTKAGGSVSCAGALTAPSITGTLFHNTGGGTYGVGMHTHTIEVSGDKVYFGTADWGNKQNSFSIADTKYYKDKVKALTVTSLKIEASSVGNYNIAVKATALNADGAEVKVSQSTIGSKYSAGYDAGYDAGKNGVTGSMTGYPGKKSVTVICDLSNGKRIVNTYSVTG